MSINRPSFDNTTIGSVEVVNQPTVEATNVNTAPPVSVETSLASGLASAGQALSNIYNGIAGLANKKLPLPNPLDKYSSYTTIFTLFALDDASFNVPDSSYIKGLGKLPIVLRGGSGYPNNRIKTSLGKFEFYIDDVVVHSNYGFNPKTGNSHAYALDFTVIEPYSMGMFQMALNIAATKANKGVTTNFMVRPFVLSLQFMGEDQSGSYSGVPQTTKYFTIKFADINMEVSEAGAKYTCKANATAESALLHSNLKITSELSFEGTTVQEVLQTHPKSLTNIINRHLKDIAGDKYTPDEIVILFPTTQSTAQSSGSGNQGATETKSGPIDTTDPLAPNNATSGGNSGRETTVYDVVGVTRDSTNQSLKQKTSVNAIGLSKLGYGNTRDGYASSPGVGLYDEKTHTWDQSQIKKDPTLSSYAVSSESTITNAINQVLLSSDYARNAMKKDAIKAAGMRTMWNIIPTYYILKSKNNEAYVGEPPKLMVFTVVPYLVSATALGTPGSNISTTHYQQLLDNAPKAYDYIYSGKNTQVKKVNLKFDALFRAFLPVDASRGKDNQIVTANNPLTDGFTPGIKVEPGSTSNTPEAGLSYIRSFTGTKTSTDGQGGSAGETIESRMAKWFFQSMIRNADMQQIEMEIVGDPFWLSSSGWGNYRSPATKGMNVNADMSVNHHNGEVDMIVRFKTPSDINDTTGLYNMNGKKALLQWSGLYKVYHIESRFKQGEFSQVIKANKRSITPRDMKEIVYSTILTQGTSQPLALNTTTNSNPGQAQA